MSDIVSKPRDLKEMEALNSIVKALQVAGAPPGVMLPLEEWVLALWLDSDKYEKWMAWCGVHRPEEKKE